MFEMIFLCIIVLICVCACVWSIKISNKNFIEKRNTKEVQDDYKWRDENDYYNSYENMSSSWH